MFNVVFILVGRSGSGKDTILKRLLENIPELDRIIPMTTRPKRDNEKYGEDYFFITKEKMLQLINSGKIMEYRSYDVINSDGEPDKWYYAHECPKKSLSIMIGTPSLVESLNYLILNGKLGSICVFPIYIDVGEEQLLLRSILREETNQNKNWKELVRRFFKDKEDFKNINDSHYKKIKNNDLDTCVNEITEYIKSKTCIKGGKDLEWINVIV